jgi:two-component system response regulator FixJ
MSESLTIFIIDPDPVSRESVSRIAKEMRIPAKEYTSAQAFLYEHPNNWTGCIVSEFRLLGMNGIELQESLSSDGITLPMIFVTAHAETAFTVRAMKNGAVTVLEKPYSEQELWDAMCKALSLDQKMRRIDARHNEIRSRLARLTQKERQVLDLMVEGKGNKAIAGKLNVSVRTVEARRQQVFKKTSTDSVVELVRMILQSGVKDEK